jgi:N-acetylglucosaminyldiphosphoundecaprenol N-acetyl-beta-D-mannosaminyltransferase
MPVLDSAIRQIFGIPIASLGEADALELAKEAIAARGQLLFGMVNAAKLVHMQRDPGLRRAVLAADVILADGMSVVWAARLLGRPLPERVTGIDLMHSLLELADADGLRLYCLGATEAVLEQTLDVIRRRHPGAVIAGAHHGYFQPGDVPSLLEAIRHSRADILFVAMGSPAKERFLARHADVLDVPVLHGVGGSFDVLAGKVRRAPSIVQAAGLEWLWRVMQEPRRLWKRYLVTNTRFSLMVAEALLAPLLPTVLRRADDPRWLDGADPHGHAPEAEGPVTGLEDLEKRRPLRTAGDG